MPGPAKRSDKRSSDGKEVNGNGDHGVASGTPKDSTSGVSKGEIIAVYTPDTKRLKIVDCKESASKIIEDTKGLFDCEMKLFDDIDEFKTFEAELNGDVPQEKVSLLMLVEFFLYSGNSRL